MNDGPAPSDLWRTIASWLGWAGFIVLVVGIGNGHLPWVTSGGCFGLAAVLAHGRSVG